MNQQGATGAPGSDTERPAWWQQALDQKPAIGELIVDDARVEYQHWGDPANPALILINQLLEPVTAPVRRMMPDMGGLDLSPLIVLLGIQVLEILLLMPLKNALGVPPGLILGL
ncbi:MAG TPA: hypothetical protein DCF45_04430 [Gammaproteobacteria bacterium]|nr:hypothetical protein [Gammaproteobacteria bacterium]